MCSTCGSAIPSSRICDNCGADNRPGIAAKEYPATAPGLSRTIARQLIEEAGLDLDKVLKSLGPPGRTIQVLATEPRTGPGIYAIYATRAAWKDLRIERPDERPLYVGKKENSASGRLLREHFAVTWKAIGSPTGHSTFRRSLAGGLRENLALGPGAPRTKSNPGYFSNFGLADQEADDRLSAWMAEHLSCCIWVAPLQLGVEVLRAIESEAIRMMKPPLNGSFPPHITEGRRRLATEARSWSPES